MHGPTVRSRRSQARFARSLFALAIAALAVVMPTSAASPLAPPSPTGFVVTAADASSISVAWNPSPDLTVTGYGVYRNGALVGSPSQTAYRFTGLACGTSYTLGVDAVNLLGFRSDPATIPAATRAC